VDEAAVKKSESHIEIIDKLEKKGSKESLESSTEDLNGSKDSLKKKKKRKVII